MRDMKVILLILYIVLSLIGMSLATSASMHGNTFFIIPAFTLPFLVMLLYYVLCFLKSYRRIKKLHRNGKHATGQMIEKAGARSGRHCRILFHDSDGAGHVCVSYWTRHSLSRNSEVSVLYEPEHPQNSCVEKYDLLFSALLFYVSAFLFIALFAAAIIGTWYYR